MQIKGDGEEVNAIDVFPMMLYSCSLGLYGVGQTHVYVRNQYSPNFAERLGRDSIQNMSTKVSSMNR